MSGQTTLPGTREVIGSYTCGHGRTHQVPSEEVTIYKGGGAGFTAGCECGAGPIDEDSPGVFLDDHITLIGGKNLDDRLWLALEEVASGWFLLSSPDEPPVGGGKPPRERREERRAELQGDLIG